MTRQRTITEHSAYAVTSRIMRCKMNTDAGWNPLSIFGTREEAEKYANDVPQRHNAVCSIVPVTIVEDWTDATPVGREVITPVDGGG
jgi:hypothetical protein